MNYPDKSKVHIYICDDGNRKVIKELAERTNINYITRLTNKNAKAGNYNNALQIINSPYVATFDADMAPTPNFLLTTLPFFYEREKYQIEAHISYYLRINIGCLSCESFRRMEKRPLA